MLIPLSYALTCVALHHVLSHHYHDACRPNWFFGNDLSTYCVALHKVLHILRTSPWIAVAHLLRVHPLPQPLQPPVLVAQ
jgi:hypothetical protein